ncbi:adenosine deaminase/editase [Lipomyces japonicus]|uniref:adenosine deaminase/editase n=1 Tax=Lipomyces japonicus TaxID=56871 RepID=UPI0034CEFFAC
MNDQDEIAKLVFTTYNALPDKCKPRTRPDGTPEWTNLAGIVLVGGDGYNHDENDRVCASIATGVKATADENLPHAAGQVLHDCHAEILAIRAFNRFMIDQCNSRNSSDNPIVMFNPDRGKYELRPRWRRIVMVATEVPCGDASMDRLSDGKIAWDEANIQAMDNDGTGPMIGRGYFSRVGVVRTKPGRADAPRTMSKSCSDKLAARQRTSLLLTATSTIMSAQNMYLTELIVPSQKHDLSSFGRAFGRVRPFDCTTALARPAEYGFVPITVTTYSAVAGRMFAHDRTRQELVSKPSMVSLVYVAGGQHGAEAIVKGRRMGGRAGTAAAASVVCRQALARAAALAIMAVENPHDQVVTRYIELKTMDPARVAVKQATRRALGNWTPTATDDFSL